jgi:PilZ domain-containing protein
MSNEPKRSHEMSRHKSDDAKTAAAERRDARRYAFICPAELIDLSGSARISARTADLSLHGCYIDTLNPFPLGTRVRLQLTKSGQSLEFRAEVTSCHMGSGMGVNFEPLTPAQTDIVVSWLEGTSSPPEARFSAAASGAGSQRNSKTNARFAAKLLKLLERKGILTRSEASDLLREIDS